MRMGDFRLVGLSVYYALQNGLSLPVSGTVLTTTDNITYRSPYQNWLPKYTVNVYSGGSLVPSGYTVNYPSGTITFSSPQPPGAIVTADYTYCFVNLFDDFPDVTLPTFQYPSVSIERGSMSETPYELGDTNKWQRYPIYINVFAINQAQRDDISSAIRDILQEDILLIDYNIAFPINADGTRNPAYNEPAQVINYLYLESFSMVPLRILGHQNVERYRMELFAELVTVREKGIF